MAEGARGGVEDQLWVKDPSPSGDPADCPTPSKSQWQLCGSAAEGLGNTSGSLMLPSRERVAVPRLVAQQDLGKPLISVKAAGRPEWC